MTEVLPWSFPPLPNLPIGYERWSANVVETHRTLTQLYRHACEVIDQEDLEGERVAFHVDAITCHAVPLLVALEASEHSDETPLPTTWILGAAELLGDTVASLRHAHELAKGK